MATKIAWTDETWNPITGCTPISEGCKNCYAKKMATRLAGRCGYPTDDPFSVTFHEDRLSEPKKWKKPRKVFVCSMGDLFHGEVGIDLVHEVIRTVVRNKRHQFLVLTKRPRSMRTYFDFLSTVSGASVFERPSGTLQMDLHGAAMMFRRKEGLPNLWIGTTCESQQWADERIPTLLQIPAAVRYVSLEPLLGPIDLVRDGLLERLLDWVIVGCESGPNRRPMKLEWAVDVVRQCKAAGVPAFVKQVEINGKVSHDMSEWPEELRVQEWPESLTGR